jgi:hypothetical protein
MLLLLWCLLLVLVMLYRHPLQLMTRRLLTMMHPLCAWSFGS